jgi:Spy/CpxP family protein refolding chaperone
MNFVTRKLAIGTVLALALGVSAFAQGPGGGRGGDPKQMVERQITGMKERLNLTADQESKLRPILEDSATKMMAVREKYKPEPGQPPSKEMMDDMAKIRKETTEKIAGVLDADQMKKYEAMMAERRGGPGGPGGRKGGEGKKQQQ